MKIEKLLIIGLLLASSLSAASRTVGAEEALTSIGEAMKVSAPGDTIFIQPGTYREETIYIDKPLVIIGRDYPVIDGMNKGYILEVRSDSVTVKGLMLINVQKSYTKAYSAIHVYGSKNFVIEDNKLRNSFFGILIERSKEGLIRGNRVIGNAVTEQSSGNGIHAWHSDRLTISDNHVEGMRDGIYLEFVNKSEIVGNLSRNNVRYGLHFMFSNDDRYLQNRFENNGAGVAVMFSKRIDMRQNEFALNWGSASYGLLLKEILEGEIVDNTFHRNTIGISADGASKITFSHNNFDNNGWAIRFHGACYDNDITKNNFRHNALDISYKGPINGNVFDQNY
ncbi:MAG TPA: nitrous oxide reductase family maturation protein NosD, partial [Caldithrix abyssi]|nr:nitrous oxide reductase family maturation protein NosD [Caldithrix abyssi]